jgi:hypothetical protein
MPVQEMRRLGTHLHLELPKGVLTIGEEGDLLVHLEVLRSQDRVQTALRLCVQCLHKAKAFERGRLVLFTRLKTPDTLADNDLEFMSLVEPIAHIAPINAHCERALRQGQELPIAGIALDTTRLFVPQLRFQALRHLERVIPHRFDVEAEIKRQKVLERIEAQPVGHQRGPLRFHIQQFRGHRLGEQG